MAIRNIYQAEVSHKKLNKYRIVKAESPKALKEKTIALEKHWNEQWKEKVKREKREKEIVNDKDSFAYAAEMTKQAEAIQNDLDRILFDSLNPKGLDMKKLKDYSKFPKPKPKRPMPTVLQEKPKFSDSKYNPEPAFLTKLSKKKMAEFTENNAAKLKEDLGKWEKVKLSAEEDYAERLRKYNDQVDRWEKQQAKYQSIQQEKNNKVDLFFKQLKDGDIESVERYFIMVLEKIEYPFEFDRSIEVEYEDLGKTLIVDMYLPCIEDIPNLKSVTYTKTKKEFKYNYYSEKDVTKKYNDSIIYQIVLQTLNYIFSLSSKYGIIDSVVFNGRINVIDKASGKRIEPYILSASVARSDFNEINLKNVDPKTWFKNSKGVSAASLANVTPVAPIAIMAREDKRFVEGYTVADDLDDSVNLAAMDWQDFENLIREIFAKEYSGCEANITRASRDGGVDIVIFDPDPIRGGKIVIQAKRYTNVVGVSAVRDLYGTVLNEGATKGILVTTSNFGNDAYKFAQGKPITLMNGANLLHLLEQHGHRARINLKEAKDILKGDI